MRRHKILERVSLTLALSAFLALCAIVAFAALGWIVASIVALIYMTFAWFFALGITMIDD